MRSAPRLCEVAPSLGIHYVDQFRAISARLAHESENGFSAFYYPLRVVPTAIAIILLWRRDPKAAAWLDVPALWPSTEFHYATLAQPVMTPLLAVLLAVPIQRLAAGRDHGVRLLAVRCRAGPDTPGDLGGRGSAKEGDALTGEDPNAHPGDHRGDRVPRFR
jgi:hypothetical protein